MNPLFNQAVEQEALSVTGDSLVVPGGIDTTNPSHEKGIGGTVFEGRARWFLIKLGGLTNDPAQP
ncbi:MAG TPA: hypothetical protein DCK93_06895 [Blastocatellia bacterium]|jgi:hypothetical protein|nr:hypothetical protein [Blastocatellia bacterium]HAF22629.1 hypothetical protein [Blastocatellia bacterium]